MPFDFKLGKGAIGDDGEKVVPGKCISSIAAHKGHLWKTIWEHPDNAELKDERKHPNILLPDDMVKVPDKEEKEETVAVEKRHRMRAKGVPCILRLRFTLFGQPRKGDTYRVYAYPFYQGGKLDKDGAFEAKILPVAEEAEVWLGKDQDNLDEKYLFKLAWVAPANEPRGVQTRLWNLDYYHGGLSNVFDDGTRMAFLRFVQKNVEETHLLRSEQLKQFGDIMDENDQKAIIESLVKMHGC